MTHWVWDGHKPLHEWTELELGPEAGSADTLITWLFEEHNFAPVARLAGAQRESILTDYLGTPPELVDGQGRRTWRAALNSYGGVRTREGTRAVPSVTRASTRTLKPASTITASVTTTVNLNRRASHFLFVYA